MKASVLLARLARMKKEDLEELEVVIQTANGGIPTNKVVPIVQAMPGFDWTAHSFMLYPQEPLVCIHKVENVRSEAAVRLQRLQESHKKMGFQYLPKARESAWIDGFIYGARLYVTEAK